MPEENVELVRDWIAGVNAFMQGEMSAEEFAEVWDPEVEVHWRDEQTYPDTPQLLRGRSELLSFTERFRDQWADVDAEPLEITEGSDDRVLTLIRQTGRGRQSGIPIVFHFFEVWTIRDRKLIRIEYFRHRADALEAAGLSD